MKEMVYKNRMKVPELLDCQEFNGYKYYVLNQGSHPCGYVELPKKNLCFGKTNNECVDINCHGGISYSYADLHFMDNNNEYKLLENSWFLGWDYAHWGDFMYLSDDDVMFMYDGIDEKYSTWEVVQECRNVINQLIKMEKRGK